MLNGAVKLRFVLLALVCVLLAACGEPGPAVGPTPRAYIEKPTATPGASQPACDPSARVKDLAGPNLVKNPSFEDASPLPHLYTIDGEAPRLRDGTKAHSGRCSVRFDRSLDAYCVTLCGYWTDPIDVPAQRVYELNVYFAMSPELVDKTGIFVTIRVPDGAGGWPPVFGTPVRANSDGWSVAFVEFVLPPDVSQVVIDIAWLDHIKSTDPAGSIWLDDLYFGAVD